MKEWFLSSELMELDGLPSTTQGLSQKAKRDNWKSRKAAGKGRALEYHISNFHEDIQTQLFNQHKEKPKSNVSKVLPMSEIKEWCNLPVYDVHAAAGVGALIESEYQIGTISIPCDLLHEYGLGDKTSSIIFVNGDSMEPTLSDNDRLLVDIREQQHPVSNGVYVIRIDNAVYVKRLQWDIANGLYDVMSDNPRYKTFQIDHTNGRNFKIIGRAIAPLLKRIL